MPKDPTAESRQLIRLNQSESTLEDSNKIKSKNKVTNVTVGCSWQENVSKNKKIAWIHNVETKIKVPLYIWHKTKTQSSTIW